MSDKSHQTANVYIQNNTPHKAIIQLYHENEKLGVDSEGYFAEPWENVGPLTVRFRTGFWAFDEKDFWSVRLTTIEGEMRSVYINDGGTAGGLWKEYQLQSDDSGQNIFFIVDQSHFNICLPSGGGSVDMKHKHTLKGVGHVFVLMLENRSFENIFGRSGLPGITIASDEERNFYKGEAYRVEAGAPDQLSKDPGHEFLDVVEQLTGSREYSGGSYPPINNSGYIKNYAKPDDHDKKPDSGRISDVMRCFDTESQLPVIYTLAKEFAICDHWFSSLPGPTWPNRFFVHGASSVNVDYSPNGASIYAWTHPLGGLGFKYPNGSIFDALDKADFSYKIYNDRENYYSNNKSAASSLGTIPQVSALSGISLIWGISDIGNFGSDLYSSPYDSVYTFIEPHYGNPIGGFKGGSSQHPMDSTYGGERLIEDVYMKIRQSPLWYDSMLVITYDEHGGFYDSVKPTEPVPPPGDCGDSTGIKHGFRFDQLGPRVPAVVISPWIRKGKVIKATMEHSVVPKTVETMCGLQPLTHRDAWSRSLLDDLDLDMSRPREDCPLHLPAAPDFDFDTDMAPPAQVANLDDEPFPESGNVVGTLGALLKLEMELNEDLEFATETDVEKLKETSNVEQVESVADAEAYASELMQRLAKMQARAREEELYELRPRRESPKS